MLTDLPVELIYNVVKNCVLESSPIIVLVCKTLRDVIYEFDDLFDIHSNNIINHEWINDICNKKVELWIVQQLRTRKDILQHLLFGNFGIKLYQDKSVEFILKNKLWASENDERLWQRILNSDLATPMLIDLAYQQISTHLSHYRDRITNIETVQVLQKMKTHIHFFDAEWTSSETIVYVLKNKISTLMHFNEMRLVRRCILDKSEELLILIHQHNPHIIWQSAIYQRVDFYWFFETAFRLFQVDANTIDRSGLQSFFKRSNHFFGFLRLLLKHNLKIDKELESIIIQRGGSSWLKSYYKNQENE